MRSYWLQYDKSQTEVEMTAKYEEEEDLSADRFETDETYISLESALKTRIQMLTS